MGSLNKVMLIGRLGADPEIRYTKGGDPIAHFRIATDERWKDKQGNRQEHTEWHSLVAFGRLADLAQNYLKKGRLVYVEGSLQTRDWVDQQNVKHYRTEVKINNIQFLERGDVPAGGGFSGGGGGSRPQRDTSPPPENYGPEDHGGGYVEDDIPF